MTTSWIIRNRQTQEVLFETFNPQVVALLNTEKYEAVNIYEYLTTLNRQIKGLKAL